MSEKRDIKLVVFDMDGTLLNSEKKIPKQNIDAINKLRKKGIKYSFCTGRMPIMAEYYKDILNVDIPIITANGLILWDPLIKENIYEASITKEEALKLLKYGRDNEMDYSLFTYDDFYFSLTSVRRDRFRLYNKYAKENGNRKVKILDIDDNFKCVENKKIYKVLLNELKPGQAHEAHKFVKNMDNVEFTSAEKGVLEIGRRGYNKGLGLRRLTEHLGLKRENVCAFGDYINDVSMLEYAGLSFAMGNGCEKVKNAADYITENNDNAGVAAAIEKYVL